jgi:hypothetical protein
MCKTKHQNLHIVMQKLGQEDQHFVVCPNQY